MNEDIVNAIQRLVSKVACKENYHPLTRCIKLLVQLCDSPLKPRDWRFLERSVDEFSESFQLYSNYREHKKICLFGSARTATDDPDYILAKNFSEAIVKKNFMVVTGAGPGIMAAGNEGAGAENSFGVNINLPFEQDPNPFIAHDSKLITYRYFFIRKLIFIRETDATVLFPGGFGTLDEAYECLTLLQTGRCYPRPVVLMEHEGGNFWKEWLKFFEAVMIPKKMISPDDLKLLKVTSSIEEACDYIQNFYKNYHSIRFFDDKQTVIRLERMIPESALVELNDRFKDILSGPIVAAEPNEEEKAMKDFLRKKRLSVPFNKINYGRLLDLIVAINSY